MRPLPSANLDTGVRRHLPQQPQQRRPRQRNAAGRGRVSGSRQMNEHGTPAAGDPRAAVVIDFDNEIIEMIVAPETITRLPGGTAERAIVTAVGGVLAPGEVKR